MDMQHEVMEGVFCEQKRKDSSLEREAFYLSCSTTLGAKNQLNYMLTHVEWREGVA